MSDTATWSRRIDALAAEQHGVVTRRQLLGLGLTPSVIDGRLKRGRLRPVHRGIYLLGTLSGPLEPTSAREMAAALACAPDAVVSHRSAAVLWGLLPRNRNGDGGPVDVTIRRADRGRRRGIRAHRTRTLTAEDVTEVDRIPVTVPVRTLIDLAGHLRPLALERVFADAQRQRLVRIEDVVDAVERAPRVRGASLLRQLVARGAAFTRSTAEARFLALVRQGGLPTPDTNVRMLGYEVDFFWSAERIGVEVDGYAYHASRPTFESDRDRDGRLAAHGIQVLRVTWRQMTDEPQALLVRLAQTLALARARSTVGPH